MNPPERGLTQNSFLVLKIRIYEGRMQTVLTMFIFPVKVCLNSFAVVYSKCINSDENTREERERGEELRTSWTVVSLKK